jgi:hypothetical protein
MCLVLCQAARYGSVETPTLQQKALQKALEMAKSCFRTTITDRRDGSEVTDSFRLDLRASHSSC